MRSVDTLRSLSFGLANEAKSSDKKSKVVVVTEEEGKVSVQVFENGVLQESPHQMIAVAKDALDLVEQNV